MTQANLHPTFCRRLLLTYWIDTLERPNIARLMEHSGWPRRTIQDIIKALPSWGIDIEFIEDGIRHNDGYYQVTSWGPFQQEWIKAQQKSMKQALT